MASIMDKIKTNLRKIRYPSIGSLQKNKVQDTVVSIECLFATALTELFLYVSCDCQSFPTKKLRATSDRNYLVSKQKLFLTQTVSIARE